MAEIAGSVEVTDSIRWMWKICVKQTVLKEDARLVYLCVRKAA